MPLKGEHGILLQNPCSSARILTRAAGGMPLRRGEGPRHAGGAAISACQQLEATHIGDSLSVDLGVRSSALTRSFRSGQVTLSAQARHDEPTSNPPPSIETSLSEDAWVQYGRSTALAFRQGTPGSIAESEAPGKSAVTADATAHRCITKREDTGLS